MYYFGCIGVPGHYLWSSESRKTWYGDGVPSNFPKEWTGHERNINPDQDRTYARESKIAPNAYGRQGVARIQHVEGWTCISFPDRSVDNRPNCVSAFLEQGTFTFEQMIAIAKVEFPNVMGRYTFEIELQPEESNRV